ncbi:MAG TPA: Crp/Fnr family transcriptional regulator [Acidimicrobiales bacterium]|nr:Crp/Fnr family transcriptional regulator [Acidimicrobiales bacterium]
MTEGVVAIDAGSQGASLTTKDLQDVSPAVASAWEGSFMAPFPDRVRQALLAGSQETVVKADEVFYRGADHADTAILALVVDGLVRTFIQTQDGRRVTIRYAFPGDVVGAPAVAMAGLGDERSLQRWRLLGGHGVHGEALRDTLILKLPLDRFLHFAQTEVAVAFALAVSLAYRTVEAEQILADGLFMSVRARVARHLMDLAVWREGSLIVTERHQEIAEAIGSVREVVSRTLVGMRQDGVVERRGNETVIVNPSALHAIAAAG